MTTMLINLENAASTEHSLLHKTNGLNGCWSAEDEADLGVLFQLIRPAAGVDFSPYKPTTIRKCIKRRMTACRVVRLGDYVRYVEYHPDESVTQITDCKRLKGESRARESRKRYFCSPSSIH
jgi:hypothetical protein